MSVSTRSNTRRSRREQNESDSSVITEPSAPSISAIQSPPKKRQKARTGLKKQVTQPVAGLMKRALQPRKKKEDPKNQDGDSRRQRSSRNDKTAPATIANPIGDDDLVDNVKYNNNVVLVYPFLPGTQRDDQLSKDLFGGIDVPTSVASTPLMGDNSAGAVTINKRDLARLEPGEYLSDSNVDFWITKWVTRNLSADAPIIAMSSLFYTTLKKDGPEAALNFHKNKDVFDADVIFVPITESAHHSLCVVANPGSIANRYTKETSPEARLPVLLFLNSGGIHSASEIGQNVRGWLNHLWAKEKDRRKAAASSISVALPFTRRKIPLVTPAVPQQENGTDCGVFECRYAVGVLRLYERLNGNISTKSIDINQLVTNAPEFNFTQHDMIQLRRDMKTLTLRLASSYKSTKALVRPKEDSSASSDVSRTVFGADSRLVVAPASALATPTVSNVNQVKVTGPRLRRKHVKTSRAGTPLRADSSLATIAAARQGTKEEKDDGPCRFIEIDTASYRGGPPSNDSFSVASTHTRLSFGVSSVDPSKTSDAGLNTLVAKLGSCSLGVSVDGNESHDDSRATLDLTRDRIQIDVETPPGMLGLKVAQASAEWVKVSHVSPGSVMHQRILEGDLISHVGNWAAMGKTPTEVAGEFSRTKLSRRFIRLWRLESLHDESECGGAVKRKGAIARRPEDGNTTAKIKVEGEDSATLPEKTEESLQAIGSLYTRVGLENLKEEEQNKIEKKKAECYKNQRKGQVPTRAADYNGKSVERQKRQTYKYLFEHARMTTPATNKLDGVPASALPQTHPCHVLITSSRPSNPNGGKRPKKLLSREKKLVVISCRDRKSVNEFKATMKSLVQSDWSDNDYEVKTAFDAESAMIASAGDRKRKPKPSESTAPKREVSGVNTPAPRERKKRGRPAFRRLRA